MRKPPRYEHPLDVAPVGPDFEPLHEPSDSSESRLVPGFSRSVITRFAVRAATSATCSGEGSASSWNPSAPSWFSHKHTIDKERVKVTPSEQFSAEHTERAQMRPVSSIVRKPVAVRSTNSRTRAGGVFPYTWST